MSDAAPAAPWTSARIFAMLAARYALPQYVIAPEVADGTGSNANRRADAVAMGCWPSSGLEVHGFEIKVSRKDWLREIADISKCDPVARHCDRWWIVAPAGIVKREELPKTWGLMTVSDEGLRVGVPAPALEGEGRALSRAFVASFLRGVQTRTTGAEDARVAEAYRRGHEDGANALGEGQAKRELDRLKQSIAAFESASGLSIDRYVSASRQLGEDVAAFARMRHALTYGGGRELRAEAKRLSDAMIHAAQTVEALERRILATDTAAAQARGSETDELPGLPSPEPEPPPVV